MTNGIAKDWTAYTEIWVPFDFAKQKREPKSNNFEMEVFL